MDEQENNEKTTRKKTTRKDDGYGNIQIPTSTDGIGGVGGGDGTQVKSETYPPDPLINIGCKCPNGIRIKLSGRRDLLLKYGFTQVNKSIWDMIIADGRYSHLIEPGLIYLSKNGC